MYRFLSSCEDVKNRTSQLVAPRKFPHPCKRHSPIPHSHTNIRTHAHTMPIHTRLPHGLVRYRWSEVF